MSDRRYFLKSTLQSGLAWSTAVGLAPSLQASPLAQQKAALHMPSIGPDQTPLPYTYDALAPIIDARTMEIHYSKHAAAYSKNLKEAMATEKLSADSSVEMLLATISRYSEKMRNNSGGHYNHELFWKCMSPKGPQEPTGQLLEAIVRDFGSMADFRKRFTEAAMTRFGSGWAWLCLDAGGRLQIGSTPNQDNPLMDISPLRGKPLLALDVWEHAYYLQYQNRRAEYIENWFKLVDWTFVGQRMRTDS